MLLFPRAHPHTHHHYNVWGVNTTQNLLAKARAFDTSEHVIFSRVAQDHLKRCVLHKTFHLHIRAQHVARAFLVDPLPGEHCFTFHSNPTYRRPSSGPLLMSSHGGNSLRRFVECDFRSYAGIDLAYMRHGRNQR